MTKDEAMKLALEKIADALPAYIDGVASRDYLATIHKALTEQSAQQEPVAEIVEDVNGYLSTRWYDDWTPEPGDKLYTFPPAQRKPLTDDEIYGMYNEPRSDAEMVEFARAIEAAHGIKENT